MTLRSLIVGGASAAGSAAGISTPPVIDAAATGAVATLRSGLKGALTWSKLSGASTIAISAAGVVSLSGALGAGGSASAVVRVQNTTNDAVERSVTLRAAAATPAPTPAPTPTPTPAPTPTAGRQIPWTFAMIGMDEVYDASVASSKVNASGAQAQPGTPAINGNAAIPGEKLASWISQTTNGRSATPTTAALQPVLGSSEDASPTGVIPVIFRGGQSLMTAALPAKLDRYTIIALMRLKSATGSRYLIGTPGVFNLLQSTSTVPGAVRAFVTTQDIETDTTERLRMVTQNVQSTGLTFTALQGREETFNTTASGSSLDPGQRFYLGSSSSGGANALADWFFFGMAPSNLSRANQQRAEGLAAHNNGLQATLEATHPYRYAPPMVPAGTTTTLDWIELPAVAAARQTFLGGMSELLQDSYFRGQTPPTDNSLPWGFPYSLISSERARLRDAVFGDNPLLMFVRLPNGFGNRGFRAFDATTGLAKTIGERIPGQYAAVTALLAKVVPLGGGLIPGVWSPPPHWKTTSSYAYGRLWAGGSYARDVSLESIRTSDPQQFAAQIEALASAQLDDLEYLHTNMAPVRGYEGPNEPISDVDNFYGTCMMSSQEYGALLRAIIPKIRNSAVLSTYNGQPNTVMLFGESFKGFDNAGSTFTNATVLSTGKTTLAEMTGQTFHEIPQIFTNPDIIRTRSWDWIASGRGKPSFVNEIWFRPGEYTDAERFSRVCAWQLHQINLVRAPIVVPIIHIMKEQPVNGALHDATNYPLARARLPAPYGQDPSTPGDFDPSVAHGCFDFNKPIWHGARFVLENIRPGAVIRRVDLPQGISGIAAAATIVNGKRRILFVNWSANPLTLTTTLGSNAAYSVTTYTATDAAVPAGTVAGPLLSMTYQPYTAYVLTEA